MDNNFKRSVIEISSRYLANDGYKRYIPKVISKKVVSTIPTFVIPIYEIIILKRILRIFNEPSPIFTQIPFAAP